MPIMTTITTSLINKNGKQLVEILNIVDPTTFSNSWINKFRSSHGFKTFKSHRKSESINVVAIEAALMLGM
jgi:hypothetical protein